MCAQGKRPRGDGQKLRKRLVLLGNLTGGGVKITFDEGSETMAGLVGGDKMQADLMDTL